MYARATTIQAQPSSIDDGITHVRDEVMPALMGVEGCVGLSLLVDRDSGRCIATSAWQSEEAMHASAEQVRPIRDRAAALFGGSAQVNEWEIAVLHRNHHSHEGACVRATWMEVDSAQMDGAIDVFRMTSLPAIEELEGFCSASLMVDRSSGRAVSSVTYDSYEAMERNREQAGTVRAAGAKQAGVNVLDVGEFVLAVAHLRVPEMA
jgi:quinol monooxygenase YgiN